VLIVRVGRGCGFVVEINGERLVLTAAHCLPLFRQYVDRALCTELICPLGQIPNIAGECLSIDVITNVAAIGPPPSYHRTRFERMVLSANPFAIALAREGRGSVMRLDGSWEPVRIDRIAGLDLEILLRGIDPDGNEWCADCQRGRCRRLFGGLSISRRASERSLSAFGGCATFGAGTMQ
jgi:hypothetical protein